ncbi:MAG TPA: acyl-CoA dehydrogenase [Steroidobacteraceae bacterium]|nr:acyl-CoA dehydrogenase [Steroidobacteraceae bacterium]
MNFDFSDEQNMLRDEVRKYLANESPLKVARDVLEGGGTHSAAVWQGLVDLGVTALMLPEACGGSGLGALELCVVAEEAGRQLAPVPLASTLYLATQVLLLGASAEQQRRWLAPVAHGAVGAFAAPLDGAVEDLALPRFVDGRLDGPVALVADGAIAQWAVVLAADSDGRPVWVVSDLSAGLTRRPLATLDPSKPFSAWSFAGTPAEALESATQPLRLLARVRDRAAVLLAFEQLGCADAALEMAAAYARERRAFGRTIGSYQGIKHKLVDIFNANQLARVHCYYGAWALAADVATAEGVPELAAASAAARVTAIQAATQAAHEGLHVHGGMGYTWDMDCHLFMRRARQQSVLLGHEHAWREQLAAELERRLAAPATSEAAQSPRAAGSMDFDDSPEEAAFRSECRAWLDTNAEPKSSGDTLYRPDASAEERMVDARAWQARKAAAGFGAITWPKALGGRGGTPIQELIWREEEGRYKVPTGLFNVSLGMVMPAVLAHASNEVRAKHIAPALKGEHLWCQLLSETGAGSDLGMVRLRAERCTDGRDGWILNGQKVWTSLAQFAQYGLVLARTDPTLPKFDGLTSFFIDMKSPGVTIRPIRQPSGEGDFNEVFLEDVFVPDTQRVGAERAGWKVTLTGLMSERPAIGGVMPPELWRTLARMLQENAFLGAPALRDGRFRERLADLYLASQALWLLQCRALTALGKGREPGPEMSGAKNLVAQALQAYTRLAIDLQGPSGVLAAAGRGEDFAMVERLWFGAAGMRIAGGTDEIVKNSIGERVLGLAPEPRTDKGVPFNQLVH